MYIAVNANLRGYNVVAKQKMQEVWFVTQTRVGIGLTTLSSGALFLVWATSKETIACSVPLDVNQTNWRTVINFYHLNLIRQYNLTKPAGLSQPIQFFLYLQIPKISPVLCEKEMLLILHDDVTFLLSFNNRIFW